MKTLTDSINESLYKKTKHNIFGVEHDSKRIMEYKKWLETKYPGYGIMIKDAKDILKDDSCINLTKENIDLINSDMEGAFERHKKLKQYCLICIYDKSHPEVYAVNTEFFVYKSTSKRDNWWEESEYETDNKFKTGWWESYGTTSAINDLKNYFK